MASLYDSASLVMIPSGVKEDKLYSIKPTDGSGDFTFSRGSDIEATRVNSSGLIEKAKVNAFVQSNQFDTTWTSASTNASVTSGQSDPNGGSTAWLVTESSDGGSIRQSVSVDGVLTFSMYLKYNSGTATSASLFCTDNNQNASFNLSTGVVSGLNNLIDASMVDVGGGWYRCSVTFNASAASTMILFPNNGAGIGSCFAYRAQLNHGLVAQDYVETTTTAVVEGLTADLPRLDYSGGASCPSLLLEPSRTNVVLSSEYVSSAHYVVSNWTGTITTNTTETLSPEGVYNATKFVKSGASDRVYAHNTQPDGAYTGSVWLKAASGSEDTTIEISVRRFGGGGGSTAKLVTITSEWQRFDVTATNLSGGTTTAMYIADFSSAGTATEFYSYGMQIEAGSYPTSYIPTYGTAAVRGAEDCVKTGISSLIGQSEGTLFVEVYIDTNENFRHFINAKDSSNTERLLVYIRNTNRLRFQYPSSLYDDVTITSGWYKIAVSWSGSNISFFRNGTKLITKTDFSKSASFSEITLGNYLGGDQLGDNMKQALSFTTALTDAECIALTTI